MVRLRTGLFGLCFVMFAFALACSGSESVAPRVALAISGSADDGGWNESAARGLQQLSADGYKTEMTQNVSSEEEQAVLDGFAKSGFSYVIAHGGEFTDSLRTVTQQYPSVRFIQTNGTEFGSNWRSLRFSDREIGYIMGYMAGLQSPSGKIGLILAAGEPVDLIKGAAVHGVTDANAAGTLAVATTADWDTVAYGKAAAEELLSKGVDTFVVLVDAPYEGVREALQGAPGATAFRLRSVSGLPAGQPEVLGGVFLNSGGLFKTGIDEFEQGLPTSAQVLGFKESALSLSDFSPSFSASDQALVKAAVEGIVSGTIVP